jgi:anti-anti-sigma regulatory factor
LQEDPRQSPRAMLRIQRSSNGGVTFTLAGRVSIEHVAELQRLFALEEGGCSIALDLQEVTLIDREAITFLAKCEAEKIKLENCPTYIRQWIDLEKTRD